MRKPIHILLFSGGVDSVLCLKKIVDRGIIPFIFHFRTKKLTNKHELMIKKTAKLLSPKSAYYVFETKTWNYEAYLNSSNDFDKYFIRIDENGKKKFLEFEPVKYGDYIILGYMRHIYFYDGRKQEFDCLGRQFIDFSAKFNSVFVFPLADYHRWEVDNEFKTLPLNIRMNTVSSTRNYDFGGGIFVKKETTHIRLRK